MPRLRRPKSEAKIYLRGILPTLTPADFVSEMIAARAKKKSKRRAMAKPAIRNAGAFVGVLMRKTIPMKVIE